MKKNLYLLLVLGVLTLGTSAHAETRKRTVYMSNSSGQMQTTGASSQAMAANANSGAATVIKRTGTRLVHQQKLTTDLLYNWAKNGNNTQLQNYQKYLNMRNEDGKTALCLAQEARDSVAYRRLLYWGADKDQSCKCSDKPCALWVNNNSNLALWGIVGVGAAVGVYKLLDGDKHKCDIKNYKLNLCPDHGYCELCSYKFKLTSCDENWQMNADETECVPVSCQTGYSTDIKSAADCGTAGESGWRIIQDTEQAYSGNEACYRCEKLDCNSGYTSSIQEVTQCSTTGDAGYEIEQDTTRYEGDTPCNRCVPDGCENNGETSYPNAEACPTYTYLKRVNFEITDYDGENVCGLCHYDCNEEDEAYVLGKCPEGKLCRQAEITASNGSTVTCEIVYDNDCSDYPYEEQCPRGMHEIERCTDQKGLHLDCEPDDCSDYPSTTCEIEGFEEKDECVTSSDGETTTTTYQCQCDAIEGWTAETCRIGHVCRESREAGIVCYKEEECDEANGYYAEYRKCTDTYRGYDCVLDTASQCYIKSEELECDTTDGYSTQYQSVADCGIENGAGYTYTSKGYSGALKCGKCTPKICEEPYLTRYQSVADCGDEGDNGWIWEQDTTIPYAGNEKCGKCTPKQCQDHSIDTTFTAPAGLIIRGQPIRHNPAHGDSICYLYEVLCDEDSGVYFETSHTTACTANGAYKCTTYTFRNLPTASGTYSCLIRGDDIPCNTEYTPGLNDCSSYPHGGIGYTWTQDTEIPMSGDKVCGKCTPKVCTDYDATYITQAQCSAKGTGYTWTSKSVYAGDTLCGECTPKVCTDYDAEGVKRVEECVNTYPHLKVTIDSTNVIGMAGDDNCYKCDYDCKDEYYKTGSSCTAGNYTCTSATENGIECWWHTGCPSDHPNDQPCAPTQGKQKLINQEPITTDVGTCYKCEYACDTNDYPHLNTCPTNLKEDDRCEDSTGNHLKCVCDTTKGYYETRPICQSEENVTTCNQDTTTGCYYPICNTDEQTNPCAEKTGMKLTETSRTLTNMTKCYKCEYECDPDQDHFANTTEGIAACKAKYPSNPCSETDETGCIIPSENLECPGDSVEKCVNHPLLIAEEVYYTTLDNGTKCYTCSYSCNEDLGITEYHEGDTYTQLFSQLGITCKTTDVCLSYEDPTYPRYTWFDDPTKATSTGHCEDTIPYQFNDTTTCYHCKCATASGWFSPEDVARIKANCGTAYEEGITDAFGCQQINAVSCPEEMKTFAQCDALGKDFDVVEGSSTCNLKTGQRIACGYCKEGLRDCSQFSTRQRTYVNGEESCPTMFNKVSSTEHPGCYYCKINKDCNDFGYEKATGNTQCSDGLALNGTHDLITFNYYETPGAASTSAVVCSTCTYKCKNGWTKLETGQSVPEGYEQITYENLRLSPETSVTCYRQNSAGDDCNIDIYRYVNECPLGTTLFDSCTKDNITYLQCECDNNYKGPEGNGRGYYSDQNINSLNSYLSAVNVPIDDTNLRSGAVATQCYDVQCNLTYTSGYVYRLYSNEEECINSFGSDISISSACMFNTGSGCYISPQCNWGGNSYYLKTQDGKTLYSTQKMCESISGGYICSSYTFLNGTKTCYVITGEEYPCEGSDGIRTIYDDDFVTFINDTHATHFITVATSQTATSAACGINANAQNNNEKTGALGYNLGKNPVTYIAHGSSAYPLRCKEEGVSYNFYGCIPLSCKTGYSTTEPTCGTGLKLTYDETRFAGDDTCWACSCDTTQNMSICEEHNNDAAGFVKTTCKEVTSAPVCYKYHLECAHNSLTEDEYNALSDDERAEYDPDPIDITVVDGDNEGLYDDPHSIKCYAKYVDKNRAAQQSSLFDGLTLMNTSKIEITSEGDEDVIGLQSNEGENLMNTVEEEFNLVGEVDITHNSTGTAIGMYLSSANAMMNDLGASVNIHSTNEVNTSIGMYAATGGTVLNYGNINITGVSNKAYGIYGAGANTIENAGNISVEGKNAYGIYVEDGTGTKVTNTETGVININHSAEGEGWGIYINNNSGDAEVNNLGTININGETKDGTSGIYLNGAELHNAGEITSAGALDLNSLGGKIYLEDGGVYEAESLSGDLTAGVASVKEGNKDEYVIQSAIVSGNIEELNVLSESALFNAELRETEGTSGYDVVQTRRNFTEVSPNNSIGVYLDKNYIEGSTPGLYEDLKSETDEKELNRKVARVTGADVLPNIVDENMIALKSLNRSLADNILEPTNDPYRVVAGADTASVDAGGKGVLSGYDMNASSMWMYGDKRLNNWNRLGLGLALTKINTSYDVGADRKLDIIQLFIPYMHKFTDRLRLASILSAGYGIGDIDRSYKDARSSDLRDIFAGFTNELRYTMDLGCFAELEPALMLNALGYYEEGLDEGNAAEAIKTRNTRNLSIEAGAGLFLKKKVSLERFGRLGFKIGGVYYRELTSPYDGISAHHKGATGWYTINDYAHLYQKDRALLEAAINYDYKAFTLELKYNKLLQKNNPEMLDLGLKYRF